MMRRFAKAQLSLAKYGILIGMIGGIATFIGPQHSAIIKAGIGIVIGAMLLGRKLTSALKELAKATDQLSDEIFHK